MNKYICIYMEAKFGDPSHSWPLEQGELEKVQNRAARVVTFLFMFLKL